MKRTFLPLILLGIIGLPSSATGTDSVLQLPGLVEGINITEWWVVGPFLSGPREPLANPMGSALDFDTGTVDLAATYPSVYQFGGIVRWEQKSVEENGDLVFNFDNPDWDKINDEWGVSGIYYTGAAYTTFDSPIACRALINAHGIGSFYINGRRYSGDPYGHRLIQTPVILDEGENRVFFMTGGFAGSDTVRFEILPAPETDLVILENDILLPDMVLGLDFDGTVGVPVLNTTDRWVELATVEIIRDDIIGQGVGSNSYTIPPLSLINIPLYILVDFPDEWDEDKFSVAIKLTWDTGELVVVSDARVRSPEDSRIVTFQSGIDLSAQKYAVRYPSDYDPNRGYALIITTHGAGVQCEGQVDAFNQKNWAFVVAPTNRRRFGFDWQDWGRLDAIEILDLVMEEYPIDPDRVYLIGHSMGGHGAWHVGSTHADRFAAIVPSAGWASFQLYVPWFLRSDELFSDPDCYRIFNQTTSPDRTERLLPNLRNVPVLAVHGADDDNVPPTHARLLIGVLDRMGYDARLWEEPGMGHWWDNSPNIPGADCVDALRIQSFCRERERDPYPRHVTFASYDIGNNNSMYWVTVLEEIDPIGRVFVDAELTRDGKIICQTENVRRLDFNFGVDSPFQPPRTAIIDGSEIILGTGGNASLERSMIDGGWGWSSVETSDIHPSKTPWFRGPIKRAYFEPFTIIAGQSGTNEQNELNMEIARNLAQRWWYRANGYTRIIRDWDFIQDAYSLDGNLILIGGPDSNEISELYSNDLPVRISDDGIWLGAEWIEGEDLACQFIYPRPGPFNSLIHVFWGNSLDGMRLSGGLTCLYSGSNLPDFLIYDEDVRLMGYAGVRAAGFFDNNWGLNPENYYIRR